MSTSAPRVLRVFVSSTFRDMHGERDELVKHVFPRLRKLCEGRGVTWGEVDLRWGITEEQAERGEVLPLCLAEVERCRPFFLGILGQRYGWVPDSFGPELLRLYPWLAEHHGASVTELEFLHGALRDPAAATGAFFYFRAPSQQDNSPEQQKLAALEQRVVASGLPVRAGYSGPAALGEMVLADLTALVERLFPQHAPPDALDREAAEHEAFAHSRALVYIGRPDYFRRLDEHAAGDGLPLVVRGEPGGGKSALLANWALRWRRDHPDQVVLLHFVGASPHGTDWAGMLRRLLGELRRRMGLEIEVPDEPDEVRSAFANALHLAAARGRVVLVIDGLNRLEDRDAALDLAWLPPEVPGNVRLVLSTLPGRPLQELARRGWPELHVEPLRSDEREQLIADYLARHAKALGRDRSRRVASAQATGNPLYLRTLLEELRLFGAHERLDERIDHYLAAPTVEGLYERVLERYEQDYERDRPGLVGAAFALLWAARRGLSEAELLDLLGDGTGPLPQAHWAPLYLAAEASLVSRSGLVGFSHDYLREAVRRRYLRGPADRAAAHARLADYFQARERGPRQIDELPWQLLQGQDWGRLGRLLADPGFLSAAWEADSYDVRACWAQLEQNSSLSPVDAYRRVLDEPGAFPDADGAVAGLLSSTGYTREALVLRRYRAERWRREGNSRRLAFALVRLARALQGLGELDEARLHAAEAERLFRELDEPDGLADALGVRINELRARGGWDEALALCAQQEKIYREEEDDAGLAECLGQQAVLLRDRGDPQKALELLARQERLRRELGDRDGLVACLQQQALLCKDRGEADRALAILAETEQTCRALGDRDELSACLGIRAILLAERGQARQALALFREQERLCRELGNKIGLEVALGNRALLHQNLGEWDEALALLRQQEQLCRELDRKEGLARSLANQALVLKYQGDLDGALALHAQAERLCRELRHPHGLAASLCNQGIIHQQRGDFDTAEALLAEAGRTWAELGYPAGQEVVLEHRGQIRENRGDLAGALALYREHEQLSRRLARWPQVHEALRCQVGALRRQGKLDEALRVAGEDEALCRQQQDADGLQNALFNRAMVLRARGELPAALAVLGERERICREAGLADDLISTLGLQGLLLQEQGELERALELLRQQERLCREHDIPEGLSAALCNQALNHLARGELERALALLQEQETICREHDCEEFLPACLGNQGLVYRERGELERALELFREQERLCRQMGRREELPECLGNQAGVRLAQGDVAGALALHEEQERLCRELGNRAALQFCLGGRARAVRARGEVEQALALFAEQEAICRELRDPEGLALALLGQGQVLCEDQGQPAEARPRLEEAAALAARHGLALVAGKVQAVLDAVRWA